MPATHNFSDLFISYSRRDIEFARQLFDALHQHSSIDDIWIDWEDIPESANWWDEIEAGIDGANVFLFIITPDSVRSEICYKEIDYADANQKRIIPVVHREVEDEEEAEYFHPAIRRHNWLFMRDEDDFDQKFHELINVLSTDLEHVNKHTRYLVRTREWDEHDRNVSYLLAGVEIDIAERWLREAEAQNKEPVPTPLQVDYIQMSRDIDEANKAETRRREQVIRRFRQASYVFGVLLVLAVIAGAASAVQVYTSQQTLSTVEAEREEAVQVLSTVEEERAEAEQVRATVAAESFNFQMIGQALLNQVDENDALAYAFEAVSNEEPPPDVLPIFYEIAASSRNLKTLTGDATSATSVDFSANGRTLATVECVQVAETNNGCIDYQIKLREVSSGDVITTLPDEADPVRVVFSPRAPVLAAGYADGTVILWDVTTAESLVQIPAHSLGVLALSFNVDGTRLATTSFDNTIRLWDTTSLSEIPLDAISLLHPSDSYRTAFSPDGQTLASAHIDGTVNLWNIVTGERVASLQGHQSWVSAVAFSPSGRRLVSGSFDGVIKLWNIETGTATNFLGHSNWVSAVAFSPDGTTLASASFDNTVMLWDIAQGAPITTLRGHNSWVSDIAFNTSGTLVASSSFDGTTKLWDTTTGAEQVTFAAHEDGASAVAYSPDGTLLASAGFDNHIRLWDVDTQTVVKTLEEHLDTVTDIAFSPDGQTIASASVDDTAILWTLATDDRMILERHESNVNALAFNEQGERLVSGGQDTTVRLWNTNSGSARTLREHGSSVTALAFNAQGTLFATSDQDGVIIIWDSAGNRQAKEEDRYQGQVNALAFSPDGTLLASGGQDGTLILWTINDDNSLTVWQRLTAPSSGVTSLAFNPDGKTLAAASQDGQIFLWDLTGDDELLLLTIESRGNTVYDIAFSPDARTLASSQADGTVTLWNLGSPTMMRQWVQANRYVREFTCQEREQFDLPVRCDDNGNFPTRTPLPTLTPIIEITATPFWEDVATQPPAATTPAMVTPFWLPPSPTPTPTQTITPSPTGTAEQPATPTDQ